MESKLATFIKRYSARCVATAFAATLVTATACSHNDGSIYIVGVLAPPSAAAGAVCTYQAINTGPFQTSGILDVGLALHYEPAILVANQLVARGDNANLRVETNRFLIQGAVVRLTDAGGADLASFTVQGAGEVDPSTGGVPGLGTYFPTLVDPNTVAQLRKTYTAPGASQAPTRLVAYFKVFGSTTGGQSLESAEFLYPIDTCYGCLVTFPAGSADTAMPLPNCAGALSSTGTTITPCVLGQDQAVSCQECQSFQVCHP